MSKATKGDGMEETLSVQINALARRLDDLERRNRRLKLIIVGSLVLLAAVGALQRLADPEEREDGAG